MEDQKETPREVKVELKNSDLWQMFDSKTNEMVLTKNGRCMFPIVELTITGLEPRKLYKIKLEFKQLKYRYSYFNGEWHTKANAEPLQELKGKLWQFELGTINKRRLL